VSGQELSLRQVIADQRSIEMLEQAGSPLASSHGPQMGNKFDLVANYLLANYTCLASNSFGTQTVSTSLLIEGNYPGPLGAIWAPIWLIEREPILGRHFRGAPKEVPP